MAEHKIQFELGGRYTAAPVFAQAHQDLKNTQGKFRECSEVAKHALGQIAGSFSGEIAGGLRMTVGLMEELGKSGMYGLVAAGANLIVTSAVNLYQSWKQAAEEHRKLMEAMQSGQQSLIADQLAAIEARERASLDETAASAANLVKQITELAAAYKGLGSAEDMQGAAGANLAIAKINSEFADRLNEAAEEMRPLVQAEKALAIAAPIPREPPVITTFLIDFSLAILFSIII